MRLPPNICLSFRPIFYPLVLHPHLDLDPACRRLMLMRNCGSRSLEAATWGICWRGPLGGAGERPAAWRPRPDSWTWPCNNHNKERNDDIYIWKICNHLNKERNDIYIWKINSHHNKERNDDINIWKFCFFLHPRSKIVFFKLHESKQRRKKNDFLSLSRNNVMLSSPNFVFVEIYFLPIIYVNLLFHCLFSKKTYIFLLNDLQ